MKELKEPLDFRVDINDFWINNSIIVAILAPLKHGFTHDTIHIYQKRTKGYIGLAQIRG